MRTGLDQGGIICPVLFSLYANDMPTLSSHVEFVLYTDDTAIIATSSQPALLVNYLETYLSDIGRWLGEWRITCVSSSTDMLFPKTHTRKSKPRVCCSSGSKSIGSILPVI